MKTVLIPVQYAGARLDKAVLALFPETSLRHRRRLFTSWEIRVDGVERGPAYKVRAGQTLTAEEKGGSAFTAMSEAYVHAVSAPWAALYKPAGLDSETLAGGGSPGLDQILAALDAQEGEELGEKRTWRLVSRLDRDVSGLVAAAQGTEAEKRFREMEAAGHVGKTYLLLAETRGAEMPAGTERVVRSGLDMADRKRVRVLGSDDPDPARWTRLTVLGPVWLGDEEMTLVRAEIARGARHQIRAHAGAAAMPIVGDPIYGAGSHPSATLYLHCAGLRIEEFQAEAAPPWDAELGSNFDRLIELAGLQRRPEK